MAVVNHLLELKSSLFKNWKNPLRTSAWRRREQRFAMPGPDGDICCLRLGPHGQVLDCSAELQRRLGLLPLWDSGLVLADLLVSSHPWLELELGQWPMHLPRLEFRAAGDDRLVMSGSLLLLDQGGLLVLSDISEMVERLDSQVLVRGLWSDTARYADRLRGRPGDPLHVAGDWLEAMSLRLGIPCLVLLQRRGSTWHAVSTWRHPRFDGAHLLAEDLAFLDDNDGSRPLLASSALGDPVWAVPYLDGGAVRSWLCCSGKGVRDSVRHLAPDEWIQLFAMIAGPLWHYEMQLAWQSRTMFFEAVEAASAGGWWEYQYDSNLLQISSGLARQLGLSETGIEAAVPNSLVASRGVALTLDDWLQRLEPRDRDEFLVRVGAMAEGSGRFVFTTRVQVGQKSSWFRFDATLVERDGRRLVGFAFNTDDIHQREEEAEASKARLAGVMDSVPGIIYVQRLGADGLRLSYCSASAQAVLGWTQAELQSAPFASYLHPDDQDSYFRMQKNLLREGRADSQYRIRNSKGDYRWMQDEARLLHDDSGKPLEVVGVCLDITEEKEAIERVFRSEESYRALVNDSPAIIWRYRPDLEILFANPAAATALDVPHEQMVGVNLRDYLSPEEAAAALQRLQKMTPARQLVSSEVRIRRADHSYRWLLLYERGLFDSEGRLIEVQAVGRDNTEVHQTRQQLFQSAKLATLGEMAAGLAHEINQPLSVIQMTITNLLRRIDSGTATSDYLKEKLERVATQVQRTAGILNHVRVFGRWMGPDGVMFAPETSVEAALSLLGQKLKLQEIAVEIVGMESLPQVMGHPDRLEQVIINLITNASFALRERKKQTPDFRPWIRISGHREGDRLRLVVEDNGGGVPAQLVERIFEPFFTTKSVDHGTGLGLSVSREIVNQMGGRLSLENRDEGAAFTIELPVPRKSGSEAVGSQENGVASVAGQGGNPESPAQAE